MSAAVSFGGGGGGGCETVPFGARLEGGMMGGANCWKVAVPGCGMVAGEALATPSGFTTPTVEGLGEGADPDMLLALSS